LDIHGARSREAGRSDQERHPGAVEVRLIATDHLGDHGPLPIADPDWLGPVEGHADAEISRPAGQFGHLGGLDHRLGRDAGDIDASAADHSLLDHTDSAAALGEVYSQRLSRLSATNDQGLEMI
jgi:hypothetical protein